ncbi:reverse transcriptase domain-containing protein [Tanacetum coccineum]
MIISGSLPDKGKEPVPQDPGRLISDEALREYCDRNYHQILPIIAEKVHQEKVQQEKLKGVKAHLNFEETSRHSESGTPIKRRGLKERLGPRHVRSRSGSPEPRRDRSVSPKKKGPERKAVFKRLEKGVFHRLRDKGKSVSVHSDESKRWSHHSSRRDTESCHQSSRSRATESAFEGRYSNRASLRRTEELSESEGGAGGHWKSKLKSQKSSIEDDLSQPWVCEETDPFTPRIRYFDLPKTRMPSHIKTYDGSEDPKDHLKIFQSAAKTERWAMPTWCHMFNSTLTGNARVWFDDLPKETIDSYDDLKKAFFENYLQQKKCIKDPVEIHNIRDLKGASECMKISGFMHGITNPELIKRLHDKIQKSVDEMMRVTTSFLRGEVAASNRERKKSFSSWKQQEANQKQNFKKGGFRNQQRSERKQDRFALLTKTSKEIFTLDKGKFKAPPPMTTPVEKRNANKFCEFHGEVGHNTDEYMHLRKQIEEMLKAGKLSHLIKEIKQNNGKEPPKERVARQRITQSFYPNPEIFFPPLGGDEGTEGPMIIEVEIRGHCVHRIYVDGGSASEILYEHCFSRLHLEIKKQLIPATTSLIGFSGEIIWLIGQIQLLVKIGDEELSASAWMNFMVLRLPSPYNEIIRRPGVRKLQAVPSTAHGMLKILVEGGVITLKSSKLVSLECAVVSGPKETSSATKPIIKEIVKIAINPEYPEQTIMIGSALTEEGRNKLCGLLQRNLDIFAWKPADMTGVPRHIAEHRLNVRKGCSLHDDSWRMCVDFKDLSKACPKDGYLLPEIDWKVESLCRFPFKCFLDAYKGYHQILMAKEDEEKTAFITSQGIFCYTKMPFDMRNAGATYQCLVDKAFHKQIGRNLQVYVDDLVIKSHMEDEIVRDIQETFKTLREINMKLNPKKYKVDDVLSLPSPKFLKDVQKLNGKLASLNRFLAKSAEKSLPFFKTLKKYTKKSDFHWTTKAEEAFKQMKQLIVVLPMLTAPMEKEELIVYLAAAKETVSAVLMTKREAKQMPIYFVSSALRGPELNYTSMEKLALALVHASKHLKRYFQAYSIIVITDQPIQQILSRPEVAGGLQKWSIELGEYAIHYRPKLSVKGQILADFIVERPEEDSPNTPMEEEEELPEPWILFTDGSSCTDSSRAGLILTNPEGMEFTYALRFRFDETNNKAKYEALIARLRIAEQMGVKNLQANVDLRLVSNQVNGTSENKKVDALSKIASTSFAHLSKQVLVEELKEKSISEVEVLTMVEEEGDTWMTPIFKYLADKTLPADMKKARAKKRKSWRFAIIKGILYKKSFLSSWLRCVGPLQANYVLREIHEGSCSMHPGTRSVVAKALRTDYYWPTMHKDARTLIRACQDCQVYKPIPRNPQQKLTPITSPWSFHKWGIDIVGPFLEGPGKIIFLIVSMDYLTKWIEAKPVATITGNQIKKFVWDNIVCRFGLPGEIISDNGKQFRDDPFKDWCEKLCIHQHFASIKHPQTNGLVERANRSLGEGVKARLEARSKNWIE